MEEVYRSQFRLPYPLYERLKEAAEQSGRSLNAELVFRVTQSLNSEKSTGEGQTRAGQFDVEKLADKLAEPAHREELKTLLATLQRLSEDNRGKK
jgi:hypothetical protein